MAEEIKKGKIIVVEGTDCSGKETQTSLLVQRLSKAGRKIERLSFPMYDTPTGKIVGGPYLGKSYIGEGYFPEGAADVDPKVASLYYAADRRYNKHIIEGLLNKGYDVVLDRYVESNMAHQGGKLFDKEERLKLYKNLDDLEYGFLELPRPDFTIFLYVPYEKVAELRGHRAEAPDQHESNPLHIRNAEHAYLELADLHDYRVIKCCDKKGDLRDIENIQEEIYEIVKDELGIK
jgi:dTMP kinase